MPFQHVAAPTANPYPKPIHGYASHAIASRILCLFDRYLEIDV
jgi:hypothetical protein